MKLLNPLRNVLSFFFFYQSVMEEKNIKEKNKYPGCFLMIE